MANTTIMLGAEPYFQRGNTIGCLCLHGFTASPHEVLWMAQHLAGEGYTVFVPRLAGHGTNPHDLARMRWWDWVNSALDGYYLLRQQCDQVYVCGLSMGGVLALLLSTLVPVAGIVTMSVPIQFPAKFDPKYLRWFKRIRPYTDQTDRTPFEQYIRDQQQQRGEPVLGRVRYGIWSTAAFEQLVLLTQHTAAHLGEVKMPALLMHSEGDVTVPLSNVRYIQEHIGSEDVQVSIFQKSDHILSQDVDHPEVFRLTAAFIAQHATVTAADS